jgi:hypothetical protein
MVDKLNTYDFIGRQQPQKMRNRNGDTKDIPTIDENTPITAELLGRACFKSSMSPTEALIVYRVPHLPPLTLQSGSNLISVCMYIGCDRSTKGFAP